VQQQQWQRQKKIKQKQNVGGGQGRWVVGGGSATQNKQMTGNKL